MNELLTHENERIVDFFKNLDRILGSMAQMAENCRPLLDGERFLSDKELAERLKVSRRTLQQYRYEGRIPYILLGGKVLYKESDIVRILQEGYRKSIR